MAILLGEPWQLALVFALECFTDFCIATAVPSIHCASCEEYLRSLLSTLPLRNLSVDFITKHLSFSSATDVESGADDVALIGDVERILCHAGYEVQPAIPTSSRPSTSWVKWLSRFGPNVFRARRHLQHCVACRTGGSEKTILPESELEKQTPLEGIQISSNVELDLRQTRLSVEGMTCRSEFITPMPYEAILISERSACTSSVSKGLLSHPAVLSATVDLNLNSAHVTHDQNRLSSEGLCRALEELGYEATVVSSEPVAETRQETTFGINGMTCR